MQPEHITIERLLKARHTVAQLVLMNRVYLPIFERLDAEIAAMEHEQALMDRARAIVKG